jgi:hypothetical protein
MRSLAAALTLVVLVPAAVRPETIVVAEGESIQAAIARAVDGDVVRVGPGAFQEDLDFLGKAIRVEGAGPATVVTGTGTGPVVTFARGETADAVLDGVTVTGGLADRGGGIYVDDSSPTILRTVVARNRARLQGSGVFIGGTSRALFANNVVVRNGTAGGDPHGVEVVGAAPTLVNNTITRGDSNGLILRGGSGALVLNNVFARNRGRGICDFSADAVIRHNLFNGNRRAALLSGTGVDYRRIAQAEIAIGDPRIAGNVDGPARFRSAARGDFRLRPTSAAIDVGDPDPIFADVDGTRNDAGFTGGPLAP